MTARRVSLLMWEAVKFVVQMVALAWVMVIAIVLFTVLFYGLVVLPMIWLAGIADCLMSGGGVLSDLHRRLG